jgi:hypothetical protein
MLNTFLYVYQRVNQQTSAMSRYHRQTLESHIDKVKTLKGMLPATGLEPLASHI